MTTESPIPTEVSGHDLGAMIPATGQLEVLEAAPSFAAQVDHKTATRFLGRGPNLPGALNLPIVIVEGPAGAWATSASHFSHHFTQISQPARLPGWATYRRLSSLFVRRAIADEELVLPHGALVRVPAGGLVVFDRSGMRWALSGLALRDAYRPLSWAAALGSPDLTEVACVICQQLAVISVVEIATTWSDWGPTASFAFCIRHQAAAGDRQTWSAILASWPKLDLVSVTLADGRTVLAGNGRLAGHWDPV